MDEERVAARVLEAAMVEVPEPVELDDAVEAQAGNETSMTTTISPLIGLKFVESLMQLSAPS